MRLIGTADEALSRARLKDVQEEDKQEPDISVSILSHQSREQLLVLRWLSLRLDVGGDALDGLSELLAILFKVQLQEHLLYCFLKVLLVYITTTKL